MDQDNIKLGEYNEKLMN